MRFGLAGCEVLDGSGQPARQADITISQGTIESVGKPAAGLARIACRGLTAAPGFIDAHSHSDLAALRRPQEKVRQGVTSEVVGNCGFSAFPAADRDALHDFGNGILHGSGDWGWESAASYLECAAQANTTIFSLVGHGTLRIAVAGARQRALTAREMDRMEGLLDDALSGGALGFSTGLMYAPGSSAPAEELERLCRVAARHGRIYATHIRDYSGALVEAVDEQISVARRAGCRLQISHFQAVGQRYWHLQQPALERIESARTEGVDVAFDCYPYVAGSTVLTLFLPQWVLDGGTEAMLARISGRERARIAAETDAMLAQTWADIFISAGKPELVGRNIADIARERGAPAADTVLDLLAEHGGAAGVLEFNQSERNLRQTLCHPLSSVISDGLYVSGRPHPRLGGTFPELLGRFVRQRKWMGLPEAVRKITDAPARRFGLDGRGRLENGFAADVVVFDPEAAGSPATFERPELPPQGIHLVIRGGCVEFSSGVLDIPDAIPRSRA